MLRMLALLNTELVQLHPRRLAILVNQLDCVWPRFGHHRCNGVLSASAGPGSETPDQFIKGRRFGPSRQKDDRKQ